MFIRGFGTAPSAGQILGTPIDGATAGSILFVASDLSLDQDNANLFWDATNDYLGIGTAAPATALHALKDDATANAVTNILTLAHTTSGTPAAGIGAGILFQAEGTTGTENVATIQGWLTNVGDGTEASSLGFFTRTAGGALTERVRIADDGDLFINSTRLVHSNMTMNVASTSTRLAIVTYSTTASSNLYLVRGRGSEASPTAVQADDLLGVVNFSGIKASGTADANFVSPSAIAAYATSTWSASNAETHLLFTTTANGATTGVERFRIGSIGKLTHAPGATTAAATATTGCWFAQTLQTYTASDAGAITSHVFNSWGANAISTAQTVTDLANAYFAAPTITGGGTATNAWAIWAAGHTRIDGIVGHQATDAASVAPTASLKFFGHNKSVADDAVITLPAVTTNGWGYVAAHTDAANRTFFIVDSTGTVTLLNNAGSVVANADTDTNICVGTAATQEPLQIKNRLGAERVLNVMFWYD